jgi:hypothetical protein
MRFICVRSQIYGTQTSSSNPSNVALLLLSITSSEMTVAQYAELHVHETSAFLGLENYLSQMSIREVKKRRRAIVNAVLLVLEQNTMSAVSQAVSGEARKTGKINCNVTFQEQLILFFIQSRSEQEIPTPKAVQHISIAITRILNSSIFSINHGTFLTESVSPLTRRHVVQRSYYCIIESISHEKLSTSVATLVMLYNFVGRHPVSYRGVRCRNCLLCINMTTLSRPTN